MRIPENIVDEIYRAIDIVEVVSDYVTLKKKGANYWALSPFVREKSPSFAVNPVKGIYKCFSSGKGGNAINFLMEMEGYSYLEALQHVAKKYNIELPEEEVTPESENNRNHIESLYIITQYAADFFHKQLTETEHGQAVALAYFKERGILKSSIDTFQLGYAPDSWDTLAKDAAARQYQPDMLVETGLCSKSEKTGNLIDRFRDRIMFPITNPIGKIVGFGGRIMRNKDEAKYINSPETVIYNKSKILFGLSLARNAIRDKNECILTEGYMDVIAMYQSGIQNVVASSGTSLTHEQVRLIHRFTRNVLLIYDGDAPGIKAALRGIDVLIAEGMSVRILILPDNHDPDSYLKAYGSEQFLDYAKQKGQDFMDFKIQQIEKEEANSPHARSERVRALAETLAHIPDAIERQLYVHDTAAKMKLPEELLMEAVKEAQKQHQKSEDREQKRQTLPSAPKVLDLKQFVGSDLHIQETELLRILVKYHDKRFGLHVPETPETPVEEARVIDIFQEELDGLTFEDGFNEDIKNDIFKAYGDAGNFALHHYLTGSDPEIEGLVSGFLIDKYSISPNWKKHDYLTPEYDADLRFAVENAMLHYKRKRIEKMANELLKKGKETTDVEEQDRLLEDYFQLTYLLKEVYQRIGIEGGI